jgi:hypothetical protein
MEIGAKIEFAIMGEFTDHNHEGVVINIPSDEDDDNEFFEVKVTKIVPMHENFGDLTTHGITEKQIIFLNDFEIRKNQSINEI